MKGLQTIYNILIFLFGGVAALFLFYLFFRNASFMKGFLDMNTIGQIGDFIGGFLGTMLTGITLILLIQSNVLQRNENDRLRTEMDFNNARGIIENHVNLLFNSYTMEDWFKKSERLSEFVIDIENFSQLDPYYYSVPATANDIRLKAQKYTKFILQFSSVKDAMSSALEDVKFTKGQRANLRLILKNNPRINFLVEELESMKISLGTLVYSLENEKEKLAQSAYSSVNNALKATSSLLESVYRVNSF